MDYLDRFMNRMKEAAQIARWKKAQFNDAVLFAQAAVESGWGRSLLATRYCNIVGVKASYATWDGETVILPTREWTGSGWIIKHAMWRVYPSWNEAMVDYYSLIKTRPWFSNALNYLDNSDKFFECLLPSPPSLEWPRGKPGWATDRNYKDLVLSCAGRVQRLGGPKWE